MRNSGLRNPNSNNGSIFAAIPLVAIVIWLLLPWRVALALTIIGAILLAF